MNYQELKAHIAQGKLAPVYLFYGDEEVLKEEAVAELQDALKKKTAGNLEVEQLSEEYSLDKILEIANTLPLFTQGKLLIIPNPQFLQVKKSQNRQKAGKTDVLLQNYLDNPSPLSHIIFLVKGKVDSGKKEFKILQQKGLAVEFNRLKGRELLDWVKERFIKYGKNPTYQVLDYLVACVGSDLALLDKEVEKVCLYLGEEDQEVPLEAIQEIVSKTTQTTIFNLVDAFAEGRGTQAIGFCRDLLKAGEKEILIVYMLARQFRLILEAKLYTEKGYTQGQLAQILQTPAFAVSKALRQGRKFSISQLVDILEKLLELDVALKTGQGNPTLLLETAIADFAR